MRGKKTGGRKKGTPNKDNPLKGYMREHSLAYFAPDPANKDGLSCFDLDMMQLDPSDRVLAELKLLKFHTPEMKSVDMDMSVSSGADSLAERLASLSEEDPGR